MRYLQAIISLLVLLLSLILIIYVFPAHPVVIAGWGVAFIIWLSLASSKSLNGKILWLSASAMLIANIFLTNQVYYSLLQYQAGSQAGRYIRTQDIPARDIVYYKIDDPLNSIHFYSRRIINGIDTLKNLVR